MRERKTWKYQLTTRASNIKCWYSRKALFFYAIYAWKKINDCLKRIKHSLSSFWRAESVYFWLYSFFIYPTLTAPLNNLTTHTHTQVNKIIFFKWKINIPHMKFIKKKNVLCNSMRLNYLSMLNFIDNTQKYTQ